jgi:hypothetical protein
LPPAHPPWQVCSADCVCMRPAARAAEQPACTRILAEARREAVRVARRLPALVPGVHYALALPPGPAPPLPPAPTRLAPQ